MWKTYRLRKSQDFQEVIENNKKMVNSQFLIFYLPNELINCRFGISIPRRLVKKATKRNYYKRQIRNMLISLIKENNSCFVNKNLHYDLVIITRPNYLENDFSFNKELLYKIFFTLAKRREIKI